MGVSAELTGSLKDAIEKPEEVKGSKEVVWFPKQGKNGHISYKPNAKIICHDMEAPIQHIKEFTEALVGDALPVEKREKEKSALSFGDMARLRACLTCNGWLKSAAPLFPTESPEGATWSLVGPGSSKGMLEVKATNETYHIEVLVESFLAYVKANPCPLYIAQQAHIRINKIRAEAEKLAKLDSRYRTAIIKYPKVLLPNVDNPVYEVVLDEGTQMNGKM